jgi:adenylate kinase
MIIFLGIAGSGKSTQGQLLAAHLHCPWISTGNLLRQKMDQTTQKEMLEGKIIDDERTLAVLDEEFKRIQADKNSFVLDGSPRTMEQARWLVKKATDGEISIKAIIHLTIPPDAAKRRLLARQRPDDHHAAIDERFREYDSAILPIVDYLKQQGLAVYEIDSNRRPELVDKDILKVLGL